MSRGRKISIGLAVLVVIAVVALRMSYSLWRIPPNGMLPSMPQQSLVVARDRAGGRPDLELWTETLDGVSYSIALPAGPRDATFSNFASVTVPPDHLFLIGDNRHNAYDSRNTGPAPVSAVRARVVWHRRGAEAP
jgi:hypothetical protein